MTTQPTFSRCARSATARKATPNRTAAVVGLACGLGGRSIPAGDEGIPSRTRSRSGVTTVTGSPSASTRRGRSRRSHFETRLGNVEMTISSNSPSATARRIASNASCSPVRPSTGPPAARSSSGSASSIVQSVCSDFGASGGQARRRSLARAPAAGCDRAAWASQRSGSRRLRLVAGVGTPSGPPWDGIQVYATFASMRRAVNPLHHAGFCQAQWQGVRRALSKNRAGR